MLRWRQTGGAAALSLLAFACSPASAHAQSDQAQNAQTLAAQKTPEPVSKALLFGAAYGKTPEAPAPGRSVGMVFVPGRGLITFDATGKTGEALTEAETEAIGLADAHAVQAQIDARHASELAEQAASLADAEQQGLGFRAAARTATGLDFSPATGSHSLAGGVFPLNRRAWKDEAAHALGIRDGGDMKNRSRLYLFGAVSGRGVGMNLLHDTNGSWRNAGLTADKGGFIGQRQTGIAWRKGTAQASLSMIDQKTRAQVLGITAMRDKRVMLSFSLASPVKAPIKAPPGN